MHSLHKVLVNIKEFADMERSELISAARSHAESATECFYESVYDWRETDCAGRWSSVYPENVMLGMENPDRIVEEIVQCRDAQEAELNMSIEQLGELAECSILELKQKLWNQVERKPDTEFSFNLAPYLIKNIGKLLNGDYYYDSYFYNTEENTAAISQNTLENIMAAPQNYALVFFDQHF